jgi:hypothetical protein
MLERTATTRVTVLNAPNKESDMLSDVITH